MISLRESLQDIYLLDKARSVLILFLATLILMGVLWAIQSPSNQFGQMPDMLDYPAGAKRKAVFFDYLTPIVEHRNRELLEDRTRLFEIIPSLESGSELGFGQKRTLESLASEYQVEWDPENLEAMGIELELRIDSVPVSLVVVQAAKESGWGTSKFAREGNNLFGEWCYQPGCGIVPAERPQGAKHEVRKFDSVPDSVLAYMRNINTGRSYDMLRGLRAQSRLGGTTASGMKLADGLIFYSERRMAYVDEVKSMIRQYHEFQQAQQK